MTDSGTSPEQSAGQRSDYKYFTDITTRWMDNDIYGHVNNTVYYSYFDSVANNYLIEKGGLDIHKAQVIGFVVASSCQYKSPVAYPDLLEAGFRVNRLGNSSVEYGIGIFKKGEPTASAHGTFTHVFVDRATDKSMAIPQSIRAALEAVLVS
ncbi:acyl-CoA thioesterase [Porticoccaceae bacterium]|jgi:acyl-CoA thioester hydrolase|nr:acyl-CoA thioesterase [Porticoccaceae bacterium]MDB4109449.1 acyl-CoA thioesterase [Porticoccaceae bacterium]MDB9844305.1 acyl-CoA thioesterase [Porticoccaceae bacterium]MDC1477505.1 acyl-CoA thioesterase [Porticoccaceae bacterium]CAI8328623.1 MAG: Long-chain acyl-CoA thioesterase FadM [SAR92 bacterium MED-G29]|tara:strand:- start:194 stop:649 length:456 start_codon:yes stop_codon:yes gene_type:complete